MLDAAKKHKEKYGTHHHKTPVFNPWDHVALADGAQVLPLDRNYYIKPVGCAEDPYEDHMPIGPKLFFSKTKPHVQSGDILICYAVGPLDLLGYYEILSPPEYDDSNERWPWFVMTKCLSPQYSARFWESNLKLTETVRSYNKQYPDDPVTVAGNKTLGALQWGKDKIKLDRDFAEHLISLIQLAGALE